MEGKVCLVTGSNSGIGKAVCLALAARGAEIIMTGRNRRLAEKARADIISRTGNSKVHLLIADLSSFQDIVELSNQIRSDFRKLDVLINNAGIFLTSYRETESGVETQWMVNHLAPYLLTRRLMDLLRSTGEARIINVSSNAHFRGNINFDNLNGKGNYDGLAAYAQSKLANVMFTKELSYRLAGTRVSSFALHPGVVRTNIGNKNSSGLMSWLWNLGKPFMISPSKGAATIEFLATEPNLTGLSGLYFVKSQPYPAKSVATDREVTTRLWGISEDQVRDFLVA